MRVIGHQNLKWVDVLKPRDEDIKFLEENFEFHHLILEEIKTPTCHPLVESYRDYLFLILHFPDMDANERIQAIEIDFLITKNTFITIRYEDFDDFEKIFAEVQKNPDHRLDKTSGHLLHFLIKRLFSETFPELDRIKEEIDRCEDKIFQTFDEQIIEQIASIKRQVLDFTRALKPQKSVWEDMPEVVLSFWGERLKPYFSDLIADYNRTLHFVETHREVIDSLHLTSSSLLDSKRNYVIKILTIFTAIILPLSLVASIYGMNLLYLPLANHPLTFWLFLGGMFLATILILLFFRKRKWI